MRVEQLLVHAGASSAVLRATVSSGWVVVETRKEDEAADCAWSTAPRSPTGEFVLKPEQQTALDEVRAEIEAKRFSVTLLFGVSGAGKTEVYVRAIRRVIADGKQALLLVPEIMLTTQLVQRLASRFADAAVSHSGLGDAERSRLWRRVAAGQVNVIIGTRSAVFAPCRALGLICVDEEQETSYKNLQAPRFHTRDVAIMRAKRLGIPVVLGSATPSLETWYRSTHRSDYRLARIRQRINEQPMPKVHIVDMREEYEEQKRVVVLSRLMERLLGETLQRGEQALLLMNRRGFAHHLYCPQCKNRITCPHCNVGLVVHSKVGQCICHYCRVRVPIPQDCPNVTCREKLVLVGSGTQRVEDVVAGRFPGARIQRVDSDTMRHRRQYQDAIQRFEDRDTDVLIGTQMIAKGLDFPFVSFVGVIHADSAALTADFRAHERLFQLITQVAGRAGRADATGRVAVQTTSPTLPALRFALQHDYESFAQEELRLRRQVGLPPYRRLARLEFTHPREERARKAAEGMVDRIDQVMRKIGLDSADVLGPNPCVVPRIRGRYRYDLLVRTMSATDLRALVAALTADGALRPSSRGMMIDVDPVSLT